MNQVLHSDNLLPRNLASEIRQHLEWAPVVVVSGARSCGKSTLLHSVASELNVSVIDLDDNNTRMFVRNDIPGLLATAPRPVCVDEFQHVLELLDGIKADLNKKTIPGQFVLTGSTRYTMLPHASQSLTGRAHIMTLWPLSQGELRGVRETFIDRAFNADTELIAGQSSTPRTEYEDAILAGGFPLALERPDGRARRSWFHDFITLVVQRDILPIREVRNRSLLTELVRHLAANSAQILDSTRIADATGARSQLINDLIGLLESVFIVHRLEAFGTTLGAKVRKRPKIHIVDTGLAASLLGLSAHRLRQMDATALTEFGHLTETFVVNELMKQSGWSETLVEFGHFRTGDQREVDLVMESDDGRIVAIEVKAGSRVTDSDFRGMRLLRDKLGDRFVSGILLNLGQHAYSFEDRLHVAPIDRLWR